MCLAPVWDEYLGKRRASVGGLKAPAPSDKVQELTVYFTEDFQIFL